MSRGIIMQNAEVRGSRASTDFVKMKNIRFYINLPKRLGSGCPLH